MEAESSLYVGGHMAVRGKLKYVWYKVDVDTLLADDDVVRNQKKKGIFLKPSYHRRRCKKDISWVSLKYAVEMNRSYYGCCTMVDDDIYWFGEHIKDDKRGFTLDLFKKHIESEKSEKWDIVSDDSEEPEFILRSCPMSVIPIGKKLYIFGSSSGRDDEEYLCGFIFDLVESSWEILLFPFYPEDSYKYSARYVALAKSEDGNPEKIIFYSLSKGSVMYYDLKDLQMVQ